MNCNVWNIVFLLSLVQHVLFYLECPHRRGGSARSEKAGKERQRESRIKYERITKANGTVGSPTGSHTQAYSCAHLHINDFLGDFSCTTWIRFFRDQFNKLVNEGGAWFEYEYTRKIWSTFCRTIRFTWMAIITIVFMGSQKEVVGEGGGLLSGWMWMGAFVNVRTLLFVHSLLFHYISSTFWLYLFCFLLFLFFFFIFRMRLVFYDVVYFLCLPLYWCLVGT